MSFPTPYPERSRWVLRFILTVLLCGILLMGLALIALPIFSNTDWVKQALLDALETSAGGPIHIDHLEVHFFPSPQILLTGLTFTSEGTGPQTSLQAKQVEVSFAWETLWQHQLVLTRGVIREPELTLEIPRIKDTQEPAEWTVPTIGELAIHDGRFHLLRKAASAQPPRLTWEGIQLTVSRMESEGLTTFHLTAQSPEQAEASSLSLQGTLSLLDHPETVSHETRNNGLLPFGVQGRVEISQGHLDRWMAFFSDDIQTMPHTRMNVQSDYVLTHGPVTQSLTLPNFQISLDGWTLSGHGRITELQTDSPQLLVSGSTSSITLKRLTHLLPPAWVPMDVRNFLADREVHGTLELLTGTVQGMVNSQDPLVAEGVVRLEEGRLLTVHGQPPVTQLSGTIGFDSQQVRIRDARATLALFTVTAPTATLHIRDAGLDVSIPSFLVSDQDWSLAGEASITHFDHASPTLAISGSAPPISIQRLVGLLPEAWIPPPVRTILMDHQVAGIMELQTGSVKWPVNEDKPVQADGVVRLGQGQFLINPNHPPLTHLAGSVVFDSNLVRILDVQGRLESSNLLIKEATLDIKNPDMWIELRGSGDLQADDVVNALRRDPRSLSLAQFLTGYPDIQGHLQVATHIEGPLARPEQLRILLGSLKLDQISLYSKRNWLPVSSFSGVMTFDHRRIGIHTLNGQLGNSPLEVAGQWEFMEKTNSSNLTIRSTIASSDLLTLFPGLSDTFSTFSGSLGTILTLSGTTSSPFYRLHVDLTDWALGSSGIITKPAQLPGTFDANGHIRELRTLVITQGKLSLPPYQLDIGGGVVLQEPPRFRIGLRSESGTGAMFPEGMILGDLRLGLSTLAITLALEGQTRDWTRWNVQGTVESTDRVRLSDSSGASQGNKAFRLNWIQKNQRVKADFSVRNLLIERLLPPDLPPRFNGSLTLTTSMKMDLTNPEEMQRSLNGQGVIGLKDGRILTSPVLSKILGILNVHNVLLGKINILESGFPVDRLTGTFSVENGVLSTKDFALKSPVMTLAAAGTFDIPTDEFDAIVTVSPFGAYSSFLKSIPLFGTLMEGERKGLTTALFALKGPRTDPQVTYLPLQSLTGGILGLAQFPLDVLKNVLTLPLPDQTSHSRTDPIK